MTIFVFLASLLGSMAIGVPVAFALIFCGVALMTYGGIFDTQIVSQRMISGADTFTLLAIPFFLLAGELMNAGGLSRRIVEFAIACVGHIRGGLGLVTVVAAVIMRCDTICVSKMPPWAISTMPQKISAKATGTPIAMEPSKAPRKTKIVILRAPG